MDGLLAILRAAHCRSTHHYFALDAFRHIRSEAGRQLARMLLKYHQHYLAGAKDPDTRFRDFQNHVVHVADNHWGGAPRAAERWYGRFQQFLRNGAWADAAHAAGILSHYFTDPLQPLHTAQSDRESVVHRPLEWSICKSYDEILSRWRDDRFRIVFRLSSRPDWLASAVIRGAELAHRSYETLVSTYDLDAARKDPRRGLSEPAIESLAELFGVAIIGWARVLDRTASEAENHLPQVSLLPSTILATIKVPHAWILRRIALNQERQAVAELLDHYRLHGDLGVHTPDEVRLIRKVLDIRKMEQSRKANPAAEITDVRVQDRTAPTTAEFILENAPPHSSSGLLRVIGSDHDSEDYAIEQSNNPKAKHGVEFGVSDQQEIQEPASALLKFGRRHSSITLASPIVDAPSIGPKTAARFERIGITNISQFLGSSPEQMVAQLRVRWIGVEQIADWQAQTRLMMSLPMLRVRDAQLLVGAGVRAIYTLGNLRPDQLHGKVLRYASTPAGKRSLRGATSPSVDEVASWIQDAKSASAAAA